MRRWRYMGFALVTAAAAVAMSGRLGAQEAKEAKGTPPAAAAWPTCSVLAPATTSWSGPSRVTWAPLATSRSRSARGCGVRTRTVRSAPAVRAARVANPRRGTIWQPARVS